MDKNTYKFLKLLVFMTAFVLLAIFEPLGIALLIFIGFLFWMFNYI